MINLSDLTSSFVYQLVAGTTKQKEMKWKWIRWPHFHVANFASVVLNETKVDIFHCYCMLCYLINMYTRHKDTHHLYAPANSWIVYVDWINGSCTILYPVDLHTTSVPIAAQWYSLEMQIVVYPWHNSNEHTGAMWLDFVTESTRIN